MGFITISGENQIANKQGNSETLNITHFVLANIDGLDVNNEPVNRVEAMPAAGDIMDTLPVTKQGYVNTNQVVYSLVMDSAIGDYDFNWVGLIDDEGVLVAVTYTPLIQKRKTAGAVPGNNLTRNFLIAFSGIQATTAIAVPAETWQIDFNARLHGIDERERLSNYDIYGHEGFLGDGWKLERVGTSSTYNVLPGVGYVGGIRIAETLTQQITATGPKSVWLDVSMQGDISDMTAVVDFVIDAVAHNDYTDGNGFNHYLTKISDIAANGDVTDVRVDGDGLSQHLLDEDPHPQYLTEAEANALYKAKTAIDYPIGALLIMDGDVVPTGFLKRNGAELVRASYPLLWAYAQTVSNFVTQATKDSDPEAYAGYYGDGDGSTTFTIPDWRGEFWRAWDDGRGVDVGRAIGSFQGDAIRNITASVLTQSRLLDFEGAFTSGGNIDGGVNGSGNGPDILAFDASLTVPTADQNRPRSISGMALVRAY